MGSRDAVKMHPRPVQIANLVFVAILFFGCSGMGPRTIDRDRFDYVSAISESWKRHTLLNLLKTRYQDVPVFLDIASVINQYSLEQELAVGVEGEFYNRGDPSFIGPRIGAGGRFADRPTITYNPLSGQDFARSVLSPIPLSAILVLIQSGYPADYVFWICTQTIQGLENRRTGPIGTRETDPEFYELLLLFRQLADMGAVAIRAKTMDDSRQMVIVFKPTVDATVAGKWQRVAQLLGLDPAVREFPVIRGRVAVNDREIAIFSRSLIQIMMEYGGYIDVPESDIAEGRVYAIEKETAANSRLFPPLIKVLSSNEEPVDAYVAVPYRGSWFWIDDRDLHSKAMFSFLVILNSFTERGDSQTETPVISVPIN